MRAGLAVLSCCLSLTIAACASGGYDDNGGDQGWISLGQRDVDDRVDHDRIQVTGRRGEFRRIKLGVEGSSVNFHRVVVHYTNGEDDEIEVRSTIGPGEETRAIDLRGGNRRIRSVEFWYDANTLRGRNAVVRLFGER